ncbi:helix-turn-helix domain-containing protein [Flavobacterium qiangtangense]|uniref:Helix-turn-helix domain-containing protein n=1 Tax=Flavobacterium qiangtangense TaxID=1442595 RepID=A0ABW1PIY3_9FLAO
MSRVDFRQLLRLVAMLREKVYRPVHPEFESEIISLCLSLLFYEYGAICSRNLADGAHLYSRPEKIAASFVRLIDEHVRAQHGVRFYADRLYITPGYLRKCIRVATGMPARYFIDTGLLSDAYALLLDESLSVDDVSDLLHFSTPLAFSAFFKKYAGLTPSKYRSSLK